MTFDEQVREAIEAVRQESDHNTALVDMLDQELRNADERLAGRLRRMIAMHAERRTSAVIELVGVVQPPAIAPVTDTRPMLPRETDRDPLNIYGNSQ